MAKANHKAKASGLGSKLKPHPLAERLPPMTDAEFAALKASIQQTRQQNPIVLLDGMILDGRHRARACEELGIEARTIDFDPKWGSPVEYVVSQCNHRNLTDGQRVILAEQFMDELAKTRKLGRPSEKERQPSLLSGKSSEYAALRFGVNYRQVERVRNLRLEAKGLYQRVLAGELSVSAASNQHNQQVRAKAIAEAGKTTLPNTCRIIQGDCIDRMRSMEAGSVRVVFADPPYNNGWRYDSDPTGDRLTPDQYVKLCGEWIRAAARLLADDGSMFVMIDDTYDDFIGLELRKAGLHRRRCIIWWESFSRYTSANLAPSARFVHYYTKKPSGFIFNGWDIRVESVRLKIGDARANPDGRVPDNIWQISRVQGTSSEAVPFDNAPPQLPLDIAARCILMASNPGDVILDPFSGNGTTGLAALRSGRRYVGIERSAKYAAQAEKWIKAQLEGKAA